MLNMYLNCHTYFSLRHGTLSVQELVDNAVTNGSKTIALTDINNTSAAMDFIRYAQLRKVKPIVGIEFRDENKLLFIGLAKNKKGFEELNRHLSKYLLNGEPIPPQAPAFRHAYIIYPLKGLIRTMVFEPMAQALFIAFCPNRFLMWSMAV